MIHSTWIRCEKVEKYLRPTARKKEEVILKKILGKQMLISKKGKLKGQQERCEIFSGIIDKTTKHIMLKNLSTIGN